jgi:hypothetical protein
MLNAGMLIWSGPNLYFKDVARNDVALVWEAPGQEMTTEDIREMEASPDLDEKKATFIWRGPNLYCRDAGGHVTRVWEAPGQEMTPGDIRKIA